MPSPQRSARPYSLLFVSLEGVRSCGAAAVADIGLVGVCVCVCVVCVCVCWGGLTCGLSRRKALRGESYRELANKLASDGECSGGWRWWWLVLGGVGIHLARHSCSCLWLSLTASATLLQSTCVCSLAFPQSARKMLWACHMVAR